MPRNIIILGVFCCGPQTVNADAISDVCAAYNTAEVCECASKALMGEIGYKNYVYYTVANKQALEHQREGDSLVAAWDKATKTHATAAGISDQEALTQMNEFGSAHRDAIKNCEG